MSEPLHVTMVNRFFAHYREPVVRLLDGDEAFVFTWIADDQDRDPADVPSMDTSSVSRFKHSRCFRLPAGLFWQTRVIRHAATSPDPIIVYTGDPRVLSTWLGAVISRARRRRVYFWTHGWTHEDNGFIKQLRLSFYRLADALLVYGRHAKSLGTRYGWDEQRIFVTRNSMGAPVGRDATSCHRGEQCWTVISRLIPNRRIDEVIRQVHGLRDVGRHVHLTIVGDGPDRRALQALAGALDLDVAFLGAVYDPIRTKEILEASDVCISPGHVGLAAVHAMSCGCPVATHDDINRQMPEFEAIRDQETGVLFSADAMPSMAETVWTFVERTDRDQVAQQCLDEVRARWTPEQHHIRIREALLGRHVEEWCPATKRASPP